MSANTPRDDMVLTLPRLLAQGNPTPPQEADVYLRDVVAALDAAGFVVIAKDDVSEERGKIDYDGYAVSCWSGNPSATLKRLVTRWKTDEGATT